MAEIEQLRADLATLEAAKKVDITLATFHRLNQEIDYIEKRIADLEAQVAPVDEWADVKLILNCFDKSLSRESHRVFSYVCYLQAKVTELEEEINTSEFTWMATHAARLLKERDDALAKVAELDKELRCERIDGGKVRDDREAISAEQNRQELAELTTIANAIPSACGLARKLVERRVESVKREMQANG